MSIERRKPPLRRWVEPILALVVAAVLIRALVHLWIYDYLPQPFFYEPNDKWMDWVNVAFWTHNPGAYDSWQTIYPPLSFVFMKLFSIGRCYPEGEALTARDCDWWSVVSLHGFYVLNIVLVAKTFLRIDRRTALPRSFALCAGMPMLYGLDRGNLILPCFTCVLLAYGPLVRSARLRWLFAGLAVNFKVYLIAAVFAQLPRRRWRWFEGAMLATIGVYLLTFGILGVGTPIEIFDNITGFSGSFIAGDLTDNWYSGTYTPLLSLLEGVSFPVTAMVGSRIAELGLVLLPLLLLTAQAFLLAAAAATWLRPEAVPLHRIVFFGAALALITAESGGYTQPLLLLFVFMEPWRGVGRRWAIVVAYLLSLPGDITIGTIPPLVRESFSTGRPIVVTYGVGIGPFVRPGLILSLAIALSCVTIRDVWVDIRTQGWRLRWRFRHDEPLLVGSGEALPPGAGSRPA